MTKDRWAPDWYIIPQWERFFFFLFLFVRRWGFLSRMEADKEGGGSSSLLGHGVCGGSGQRRGWKTFWPGNAGWGTHTQIEPDTRPCAVTLYLSILFIIVRHCKRQTGKGYDVTDREFVATEWSGNASSGGHFSCGVRVCVYISCVLWTLFQAKDCNKFGHSAELVLKFTHTEKHTHTTVIGSV